MNCGDAATWVGVVVAIVGVWVAYSQLSGLNTTLRMNGLMAVLQIETEINSRKEKLNDLSARIREEAKKKEPDSALVEILNDQLNAAIENYLNAVDRLAFCILKEYLTERDWKTEYSDAIATDVRAYEDRFGAGTVHRNILDLHEKWQRE